MLFSSDTLKKLFPESDKIKRQFQIKQIMLDSRKQKNNSLFIPIIGERFNAHDYIEEAIKNGAIASLWDRRIKVPEHLKEKCCFFYVDDTITALQQLAQHYRYEINPIVIAITGSNGKTSTKDIVASLLKTTYKTHKTEGNFNNHIGLPLTILQMPRNTEVLILEMGMNNFGEIDQLSRIAFPDYAIITNIGESHIEFLGSREGIAKAKLEVTNGLKKDGTLIIDGDEPLLEKIENSYEVIYCGFNLSETEPYKISDVKINIDSTLFTVNDVQYHIPLLGAHHAKNATFALILAKKLGLNEKNIRRGFKTLDHSKMRFEKIDTKHGAVIINDAYNASPTSMKGAIEVVKLLEQYSTKVLVLGDIFELGKYAPSFHRDIGEVIKPPIDVVFTIGTYAKEITENVKRNERTIVTQHFDDEETLIERLTPYLKEHTLILFKASRGMALEKIIEKIV